ncbi:MAG: DinB family protein [Vicinamibacteria bacterium]
MDQALEQAFARLEARRKQLLDLAAGSGEAAFNQRPRPDAWSAAQALEHVLLSESLSIGYLRKKMQAGPALPQAGLASALKLLALRAFLASPLRARAPKVSASVPDQSNLEDLRARWDATRSELKGLLDGFPPELLGRLVFRHPFVGMLTLPHTLGFLQAHFDHHERQVRAALDATRST